MRKTAARKMLKPTLPLTPTLPTTSDRKIVKAVETQTDDEREMELFLASQAAYKRKSLRRPSKTIDRKKTGRKSNASFQES